MIVEADPVRWLLIELDPKWEFPYYGRLSEALHWCRMWAPESKIWELTKSELVCAGQEVPASPSSEPGGTP